MFYVIWKKGLHRVFDNKAHKTAKEAELYGAWEQIQRKSGGWDFSVLRFGKPVQDRVQA